MYVYKALGGTVFYTSTKPKPVTNFFFLLKFIFSLQSVFVRTKLKSLEAMSVASR